MALFDSAHENKCIYENQTEFCHKQSSRNKMLTYFGHIFGVTFTIEAVIKIIAMGFVGSEGTYLRDGWNLVDFVVVVSWLFELITQFFSFPGVNLRPLRTLRLFRPLKAMKTVPSLRKQIVALFRSVKGLLNVIVFIMSVLILFSILGLTLFVGIQNYTCRGHATLDGTWQKIPTPEFICLPLDK